MNPSTDLASILRALSGQAPTQNIQPEPPIQAPYTQYNYDQGNVVHNHNSFRGYQDSHYQIPYSQPPNIETVVPQSLTPQPEPGKIPSEPVTSLEVKPEVDPRTIITWAPALRYVTRLLNRSEDTANRIRKMIKSQHDHEKQWAEGRVAIVKQRNKREQGRNAINDVLRAVGGVVESAAVGMDAEDEATALANYDKKVYRACVEMAKAMTVGLSALGIPFFATNRALIRADDEGVEDLPNLEPMEGTDAKTLAPVTLKELQKRMLELLEDLCRE